MPFIPNRWLILRLRSSGPFVRWRYSDSLGRVGELSWDTRGFLPSQIWPPPAGTETVNEFHSLISTLVEGLPPTRWGDAVTDIAPLAVFVELPPGLPITDLKQQLSLWPGLNPQRVQVIQLSRARQVQRSPFQLPLNVFAIGQETPLALSRLEESSWYAGSAQVREFGLRIQSAYKTSPAKLKIAQNDILLADASSPLLQRIHRLPAPRRPRLVVVLDKNFQEPFEVRAPAGVAVLRLPDVGFGPNVPKFLRAFTYGILHDFPLHEAVKSASLEVGSVFDPLLVADPLSNQSLRFADALSELKRQNEKWEATLPELDFGPLLSRMENVRDPSLQSRLPDLKKRIFDLSNPDWKKRLSAFRARPSGARSLPFYFTHESDSLVPMASVNAEFAQLANEEPSIQKVVDQIVADGEVAALLKTHQQRFVDVALARQETEPVLEPLARSNTLQIDRTYQLRAHVGNRLPDSLVVGPAVPVDPILPQADDTRGHLLEFVVQGKDFTVISDAMQEARLPEFGATEPVYFQIRTPKEVGTKQLRVCLYSKNYLIQSYQLAAEVTETELTRTDTGPEPLTVKLEFSRTDKFSDLDEFRPRLLSIGANSSDDGATHKLIFKGEKVSGEITLFPVTYEQEVQKFRDTLESASKDPANPKLTRVYPPVRPGQTLEKDVAQTFRKLVRQGRELYDSVFSKSEKSGLRPSLVKVAEGPPNEKLQVIRFDASFVFPWSILYDFALPDEIYGEKSSPVCLGIVADGEGNSAPCGHSSKDKVYCVNGFWGVRHYVEEMIGEGTNTNPKITKAQGGGVRIVADTSLSPAKSLINNLNTSLGQAQVVDGPVDPDQLLDLLWADPPQRPSILIVLGHLAKRPIVGEPEGARIVLVPKSKWLLRRKISERSGMNAASWCQPRSLVFLMACESAATEVSTVNDFVTAWNTAGAGAIVGTECIVGADLAATLAEEVTTELWNGKTLGEAMTNFRRKAVNGGNPLGLVFHALGDVDLTVN
jgi:CHAT domain